MSDITLYQFSRAWGLPNPSPFCMKLEGYLKLGGIDYQVKSVNDPRKGPKGKLPYVSIGKQTMADSELIYDFLKSNQRLDLDSKLPAELLPSHRAMQVMCDESLYFTMIYSRWVDETNWPSLRDTLLGGIPKLVRGPISTQIRKKVRDDLKGQGMGRHKATEIYSIGSHHIEHMAAFLGDNLWFGGEEPAKLDVVAVSHLANIMFPPIHSPMQDLLLKQTNLVALVERGLAEIYGMKV